MKERYAASRGSFVTATVLLLVGSCEDTPPLEVRGARDLGALTVPESVSGRSGGSSVRVGDRTLWLFHETHLTRPAADGVTHRSSTAAWGDGDALQLSESLDAVGAPFELLPLAEEERRESLERGPAGRLALWPRGATAGANGRVVIVYEKMNIRPGVLNFEPLGVGVADLGPEQTVAMRDLDLLFRAPEPQFSSGLLAEAGQVYLYGCASVPMTLDTECKVVRAPADRMADRNAWTAWTGDIWVPEIERADVVMRGPPGQLSVSWNPWLGRFLAVYSRVFSNEVVLRSAPRPEGPWSEPKRLFTIADRGGQFIYSVLEHPHLATEGGREVLVTYTRRSGDEDAAVRLARADLRQALGAQNAD